jgi:hypothetical protein
MLWVWRRHTGNSSPWRWWSNLHAVRFLEAVECSLGQWFWGHIQINHSFPHCSASDLGSILFEIDVLSRLLINRSKSQTHRSLEVEREILEFEVGHFFSRLRIFNQHVLPNLLPEIHPCSNLQAIDCLRLSLTTCADDSLHICQLDAFHFFHKRKGGRELHR